MVNLTRIYTRTGDTGTTSLGDFSRTRKTDPRLAAYADANEANAAIGVALEMGGLVDDVRATLRRVQNDLFDVGADLCTPLAASYAYPPLRVQERWIEELEADCDRYNEALPALRSFILPGGGPGGAYLHLACTVVRRAERSTWAAIEAYGTEPTGGETAGDETGDEVPADGPAEGGAGDEAGRPGGVNPLAATYLNRLSDLLFILARVASGPGGDVLWTPGGGRAEVPQPRGRRAETQPSSGKGEGAASAHARKAV